MCPIGVGLCANPICSLFSYDLIQIAFPDVRNGKLSAQRVATRESVSDGYSLPNKHPHLFAWFLKWLLLFSCVLLHITSYVGTVSSHHALSHRTELGISTSQLDLYSPSRLAFNIPELPRAEKYRVIFCCRTKVLAVV